MLFNTKSNIDYIVVGLGNPGKQYDDSRHNVGFCAIDRFSKNTGIAMKKVKFSALSGTGIANGARLLLLKPQAFMNLSGNSVAQAAKYYKIEPKNIIILYDDISLAPGRLRIRKTGSAGGHNGLKSIISQTGQDFLRIKIGVGEKPHPDYDLADWVLSKPSKQDADAIRARYDDVCEALMLLIKGKTDEAMCKYSS